jgi:hypothetical protein
LLTHFIIGSFYPVIKLMNLFTIQLPVLKKGYPEAARLNGHPGVSQPGCPMLTRPSGVYIGRKPNFCMRGGRFGAVPGGQEQRVGEQGAAATPQRVAVRVLGDHQPDKRVTIAIQLTVGDRGGKAKGAYNF